MNIWGLQKHTQLKFLLLKLDELFGGNSFLLDMYDETNFYGMSLHKPDQPEITAYIHVHGQAENRYGAYLDYPEMEDVFITDSHQVYDNLGLRQIVDLLAVHFEVATYDAVI